MEQNSSVTVQLHKCCETISRRFTCLIMGLVPLASAAWSFPCSCDTCWESCFITGTMWVLVTSLFTSSANRDWSKYLYRERWLLASAHWVLTLSLALNFPPNSLRVVVLEITGLAEREGKVIYRKSHPDPLAGTRKSPAANLMWTGPIQMPS